MKTSLFVLLLLAALCAPAATLNYNGDTTGDPVWNRPLSGNPPAGLSAVGTATPYETFEFSVGSNGAYDFLSVATGGWDNFLFLYHTSFSTASPLTNVIIGSDDFPNIGLSGFNGVNLSTGVSYILVTTGFENNDFGQFSNSITGPGPINPGGAAGVPEPSTWALAGLGLAALGVLSRRRS